MFARSLIAVAAGVVLFGGELAQACFIQAPLPVQVWNDYIDVEIHDQVCVKKYDCHFLNPNPQAVVGGTCYMEVEPGAQVDNMSMTVNGKEVTAELLDLPKARQVFQEIVRKGGSPALLEYYGNQLIQTQVPAIAPNGTVIVKLQYSTVVKSEGGLCRLQMLNTNPKALLQPLNKASVKIKIRSSQGIKNVYSPTHPIKIRESGEWDVVAEWEQERYLPKTPFVFYYGLSDEAVGANLVAYRDEEEPGAFLLMVSPEFSRGRKGREEGMPKDVVFVVDTSGSMVEKGYLEQAKEALRHCVQNLRAGDRFNVVSFGTEARVLAEGGLLEYSEETRARAMAYIDRMAARGGTATHEALMTALDLFGNDERVKMMLLLTDGNPTIGETNVEQIVKDVAKKNGGRVRLFGFGIGQELNTRFLDALAKENGGESDYIVGEERAQDKIGPFFGKLSSPILSEIRVRIDGVEVTDVFPKQLPDLYQGSQLVLMGRYERAGEATVEVRGRANGKERSFSFRVVFPERATKANFVPRLWAGRKVAFLLDEIRRNGENREVVEEVVHLARRYGIVTPYTSYLVVPDGVPNPPGVPVPTAGGIPLPLASSAPVPAPPAPAEDTAMVKRALKAEAEADGAVPEAGEMLARARRSWGEYEMNDLAERVRKQARGDSNDTSLRVLRYIGTRTFYKHGDMWYDSEFDPEKHKDVTVVKLNSDEYFKMIEEHEAIAKYLALGRVVVYFKKTWYRFE